MSAAATSRGRRCRPTPRAPGELRPTDVVGAFFLCGIAFLVGGAALGVLNGFDPFPWGRWLALHLAFVGGVSQLILGASQFFAGAFLATDPPDRRIVRLQLATWNSGTILLAVAVPERSDPLLAGSVALLLVALALYGSGLAGLRRRSLGTAPWATRWYVVAAALFAVGIVAGGMLARPIAWPHGDLLAAHMALNVAGWFGLAIVGTLHTFFPSLTQSRLRFPHLQAWTFASWTLGTVALAIGYAWSLDPLAAAGWLALTLAAAMLGANVLGSVLKAARPLSLPARVVALAQLCLLGGLVVATAAVLADGPSDALVGGTRAAVGTLLLAGWVGLTVLGSLVHLLAVVVRVRDLSRRMPAARPLADGALAVLAALGVTGVAAGQLAGVAEISDPFSLALIAAYALLGARVLALGMTVALRARPMI